jgi:phospholipid-binding lipoprotein MlaA
MARILTLLLTLALPLHALCSEAPGIDDAVSDTVTQDSVAGDEDFPLFDDFEVVEVSDPLETFNRGVFWFNDKLYFYVMKPVARVFRLAPEPLRISIKNFFNNLEAPVHLVNAALQGKFSAAGDELTRFVTNTTLGIGGLYDPAREHFGIRTHDEDTGQTLGHYGVGPGPYLVLPFLGPSNVRDGISRFGDAWLDLAWQIWGQHKSNYDYLASRLIEAENALSLDKDTYEGVKRDALDPYLFMRDAYVQYRRNQVRN